MTSCRAYAIRFPLEEGDLFDVGIVLRRNFGPLVGEHFNFMEDRIIFGLLPADTEVTDAMACDLRGEIFQIFDYKKTATDTIAVVSKLRRKFQVQPHLLYFRGGGEPPEESPEDKFMKEVPTMICDTFENDDYFEQRPILLQSLEILIRRLDRDFLEAVANRLMSVLRAATKVGSAAIPVWHQFTTRLTGKIFKALLPRILIDIQPLLQYDSSDELISLILNSGNKLPSDMESTQELLEREHIVQTTFVLIGCDINGAMRLQKYVERMPLKDGPSMASEELIKTCVRLLSADCETVGKDVLQKLHSLLDGGKLTEELYSLLIAVLLQTLRRCCDPETRILTVMCIGRLGSVDPGRLEISHTVYSDETTIFVDDKDDFFVDLIERTWRAYSREPEFKMLQQIECAIQELILRVVAIGWLLYFQAQPPRVGISNINGALFHLFCKLTYSTPFGIVTFMPAEALVVKEHHDAITAYSARSLLSRTFNVPQ